MLKLLDGYTNKRDNYKRQKGSQYHPARSCRDLQLESNFTAESGESNKLIPRLLEAERERTLGTRLRVQWFQTPCYTWQPWQRVVWIAVVWIFFFFFFAALIEDVWWRKLVLNWFAVMLMYAFFLNKAKTSSAWLQTNSKQHNLVPRPLLTKEEKVLETRLAITRPHSETRNKISMRSIWVSCSPKAVEFAVSHLILRYNA